MGEKKFLRVLSSPPLLFFGIPPSSFLFSSLSALMSITSKGWINKGGHKQTVLPIHLLHFFLFFLPSFYPPRYVKKRPGRTQKRHCLRVKSIPPFPPPPPSLQTLPFFLIQGASKKDGKLRRTRLLPTEDTVPPVSSFPPFRWFPPPLLIHILLDKPTRLQIVNRGKDGLS